jgi:hypothetical protein
MDIKGTCSITCGICVAISFPMIKFFILIYDRNSIMV